MMREQSEINPVRRADDDAGEGWAGVRNPGTYLRTAVVNGCRGWGRHQTVVAANRPDPPNPVTQEPDELWDALASSRLRLRRAPMGGP